MTYSVIFTRQTMWSRKDDLALTLGDTVIVDDNRFSVQHIHMNQWNLMIRDVLREDQGQYVCVINTEPLKSKSVVLQVVGKVNSDSQTTY